MQSHLIFFLIFLIILPYYLSSATDIPLGATLSPTNTSSSWQSPNQTFSLSFIPSPSSPSLFLAAIIYSGGVPVWSADGSTGVNSNGLFRLSTSGNLELLNSSGGAVVWSSNTTNLNVTSASLLDTGNLVLKNQAGAYLWQSFLNPTDTLVENQNFTLNQTLASNSYVFSILQVGNLTLRWNGGNTQVTYFNEGFNATFKGNRSLTFPTLAMQSNGIVSLYDASLGNTSVVIAYSANYGEPGDMMRFVRLDNDGNFRAYSVSRGTATANEQWSAVADQCQVFGFCGNMGVCSYNNTSPVCGCPSENFDLVDSDDPRQGCKPTVETQNCPGNSTMLTLPNTQFLTYPPEITSEQFFVGITACRLNCLSGSSCLASTALSDGSGQCFLKVSSFVSAYQSAALPSTSFVKVCSPAEPNPPPGLSGSGNGSSLPGWVVAVVVLGSIIGVVALEYGLWWIFCRNNPKYGPISAHYALLEYASGAPVQFSYRELERSTKGFKEKLGAGGFGAVYRGVLANKTVVAVKQLEGIEQGEKQFRMEVATISSTHHLNLVRLIGFCSEGRHRLLVYEFMKNGSLDAFLFGEPSGKLLPWAARFGVAMGTARGITYLHEECRDCIVHCDIKPENILLDDNCNAKVSDFGLAKLINPKDHRHRTLTSVRGTRGYLAPEWLANLPITSKSDVYSYGMVLLEIVSGRRNFDMSEETDRKKFSTWAYEEYEKGNIASIVDKRLLGQELDMSQVERAVQVSFWCIQEQPSQRPPMGKVVQMLEGIMEIEKPPPLKSTDASLNLTSGNTSVSILSTFATSAPVPSSPNLESSPEWSSATKNPEQASLSLLASELSIAEGI